MKTKSKIFYGWIIVFAGCLIQAAVMGIVYNCFSQFIKPVCADLGFSRSAMSFNQTLISLVQVAVSLSWGKLLSKFSLKKIMFFWAIVGPAAYFCYSLATPIWMFYIVTILASACMSCLCVLPFSYMLSNWFYDKRGLATGITFMGSGIGGMIFNPLLSGWIEAYGWRTSFQILAVIMAVITIPCVFLLKTRPEDIGLMPLGYEKHVPAGSSSAEEEGYMMKEAVRMPKFWSLAVCGMLINMGLSTLVQTLSPHMTDSGYSVTFAATMVSVSMAALALGKMALGQLFDMLGIKRAALFSVSCGLVGLFGMIFCGFTPALALVIIGIGFGCSLGTVGYPIILQTVFGKKDYASILGIFTACSNIGGSISPTANGLAYDTFLSYRPAYFVWAASMVVVIVLFVINLPSNKQLRKDK